MSHADSGADLTCPFCSVDVPHYPGGTVSDVDDVWHLTRRGPGARRQQRGSAFVAPTTDNRDTVYAHGPCWRSAPPAQRDEWAMVVVTARMRP